MKCVEYEDYQVQLLASSCWPLACASF